MYGEHPIPQQVSSYEFRLVGDMTIKQFMQVAGGTLVALFIYSTSLPPFIKWPLILLSFLTGIALAFFPLEDRPLSKWIILFIKAIYSPTVYVWKKGVTQQNYFEPEVSEGQEMQISSIQETSATQEIPKTTIQQKTTQVTPFPEVKTQEAREFSNLERLEKEFLTKVSQHFNNSSFLIKSGVQTPTINAVNVSSPSNKKLSIPKTETISIEKAIKDQVTPAPPESQSLTQVQGSVSPISGQEITSKQAVFSLEATPPNPTTTPNVIVGQVLDQEGKIIENAILEIKDAEGRPVRALKSNKLGHFMIVTPLTNGHYTIFTEKEGYEFKPLSFEAKNTIIPPIVIWAEKPKGNKA